MKTKSKKHRLLDRYGKEIKVGEMCYFSRSNHLPSNIEVATYINTGEIVKEEDEYGNKFDHILINNLSNPNLGIPILADRPNDNILKEQHQRKLKKDLVKRKLKKL